MAISNVEDNVPITKWRNEEFNQDLERLYSRQDCVSHAMRK
jgi:hypothetical protein